MSTTLTRGVAMGYAAGDVNKPGIVIEVQQGMVNRGADISWLSQYPHEEECAAPATFLPTRECALHALASSTTVAATKVLHPHFAQVPSMISLPPSHTTRILFGPLTGIEVLRTRIEGTVVVIECAFSINLTALTLEQVRVSG